VSEKGRYRVIQSGQLTPKRRTISKNGRSIRGIQNKEVNLNKTQEKGSIGLEIYVI